MSIDATICIINRTGKEGLHVLHDQLQYKGIAGQFRCQHQYQSIFDLKSIDHLHIYKDKNVCTFQKRINALTELTMYSALED